MKIPRPSYIVCMICLCLPSLFLTGCHRKEQKIKIGFSQCSTDDWRKKMNEEVEREVMFLDGVDLEIRSADDSNERQIRDIRDYIDQNVDVIVMSPNEAEPLQSVVKEAMEKGIPVLLFDRSINDTTYTAFRGADNYKIGNAAGKLAYDWLGDNLKILEIQGLPGSTPSVDRSAGFHDFIRKQGLEDRIIKVEGKWNYEDAMRAADSVFALHKDINLIYAHNDRMGVGGQKAALKRGMGHIRAIGVDAAPEIGIQAVKDGDLDATFFYPTNGGDIIQTAVEIAEGKPFTRDSLYYSAAMVDASNAEMLLRQNDLLKDESAKISLLQKKVDEYLDRHTAQTTVLYAAVAIMVLLAIVIFLLMRTFWSNRRHRFELQKRNRQLDEQNHKLDEQNHMLEKSRDELDAVYRRYQEEAKSKLVFFTNVSHDLRTPLTLIADPVEQLAAAHNLTPGQQTLMRLADKNVKILLRLINQILDFRKYENGKLQTVLTEVDLRSLAADWAEGFRIAAIRRHLNFKVEIPEECDMHIALDREKFERVFFNLVGNAFKFTPDNGDVTVRFAMTPEKMTMTVSDTGRGMSQEETVRVFERFYQIDAINPNGSGIGLSLAKAFVELMGGTIKAESEKGKGSEFIVEIPRRHVETADMESQAQESATIATATEELSDIEAQDNVPVDENAKTVLVIDDNADIRTLLQETLGGKYSVLQAADGAQGLRRALKHIPDLIVCDVMMPDMDGMEVCRRIKEEMATSHIPVLMLTACSMDEQRIQGYECGADAYISKPFNSKVMTARVDSLIENRRRIAEKGLSPLSASADAKDEVKRKQKLDAAVQAKKVSGLDIDNEFYHKFVGLVDREMANSELSVEWIAEQMGLSRVQFYRKLKALTNYSPAEMIRMLRLKKADHLLRTTEDTVSEICYTVGFSSPSYFTKCYREQYGETPAAVQTRTSKAR